MPFDSDQTPFPDPVFTSRDDGYDLVCFDGTDFRRARAQGASFLECSLVGANIDEAHLESSRWSDCTWERVGGVGVTLSEASLIDLTLTDCRLAAVSAWSSTWRDVTVRGGKIDFLNLRGAKLKDVAFIDCVITELDLQEATVSGLSFEGCTLVEPEFGRGSYAAVDLSGATLRSPRGVVSMKGVTVSRLQLIDLAEVIAAEVGLQVAD